jgi:DNA-binding sugar fermentation-stimulating protein
MVEVGGWVGVVHPQARTSQEFKHNKMPLWRRLSRSAAVAAFVHEHDSNCVAPGGECDEHWDQCWRQFQ